MSAPEYAHLCESGHFYYNEDPCLALEATVKVPKGCPCGKPLLEKLAHYGDKDVNECRRGDKPPLAFIGFDTITSMIRISNAVDRQGFPVLVYHPVTHRFPHFDVTPILQEKSRMQAALTARN
jgi:hypothetical protein